MALSGGRVLTLLDDAIRRQGTSAVGGHMACSPQSYTEAKGYVLSPTVLSLGADLEKKPFVDAYKADLEAFEKEHGKKA